jgi:ABC-type polysaccharide/polyol phosphate export permease
MLGFANLVTLPALLPAIILLFIFGWSMATLMAIINVLFQDTQHLADVLLQIVFYLTPIMYPPKLLEQRSLGWIVAFNPVTPFLELVRLPITEARVPSLAAYGAATAIALLAATAASLALARIERRMVFYL